CAMCIIVDRDRMLVVSAVFFFFFSSRRRHTRLVSDWSSDVCSSDLSTSKFSWAENVGWMDWADAGSPAGSQGAHVGPNFLSGLKIGRASCRERVEISVGAVSLEKKETNIEEGRRVDVRNTQ